MRILLNSAMIHETIVDFVAIWIRFVDHFCDDLFHKLRNMRNIFSTNILSNSHLNYDFFLLNAIFTNFNKIFANYEMFVNVHNWMQNTINSLINNELNYNSKQKRFLRNEKIICLNQNQLFCFNTIITIVDNNLKKTHFFL